MDNTEQNRIKSKQQIINVLLSGGIGSRLWPLSRKARPKQYLPIFEGETLFHLTAKRNHEFCDKILVVGNKDNYLLSREALENLDIKTYQEIIEACPRNTAAAIAFAALASQPEDILFITPSDHLIQTGEAYSKSVNRAIQLAKEGFIVTFGLKPVQPETGFGYIEAEGEEVKSFREKPNLDTAEAFIKNGNFFWNSGMFCFKAGVYLEELKKFEPEVYHQSVRVFEKGENGFLNKQLSTQIPSISVDYAVMEQSKKIKVVLSDFKWSDMGSFESIYDYLKSKGHPVDKQGNMTIGTSVFTEFVGLKKCILVHTQNAILILKKEKAQEVKKVYERLEKENSNLI